MARWTIAARRTRVSRRTRAGGGSCIARGSGVSRRAGIAGRSLYRGPLLGRCAGPGLCRPRWAFLCRGSGTHYHEQEEDAADVIHDA